MLRLLQLTGFPTSRNTAVKVFSQLPTCLTSASVGRSTVSADIRDVGAKSPWSMHAETNPAGAPEVTVKAQFRNPSSLIHTSQAGSSVTQHQISMHNSLSSLTCCASGSSPGLYLTSMRHYARPPYSVRSGTPAPVSRPEFEKVKQAVKGAPVKWHRSVMRFPTAVTVELTGRKLLLSGKAGSLKLDLAQLDPTGLVAFKFLSIPLTSPAGADATVSSSAAAAAAGPASSLALATAPVVAQSMMVLISTDKERFLEVSDHLEQAVHGVMQGYLVGLTVKGVGYRLEPYEGPMKRRTSWYFEAREVEKTNITYPFPRPTTAVRCKVGYSCAALFPLPPGVRAFFLKPTIMYLYGLKLAEVESVAAAIRAIRKPNTYTGNGIQRLDEVVKLKARAGSK